MINITKWTVNPFQENTYLLYGNQEAVIIDPGFSNAQEFLWFTQFIEEHHLKLTEVWFTHAHIDHVLGLKFIEDAYPNLPVWLHPEEEINFNNAQLVAQQYGIPFNQYKSTMQSTHDLSKEKELMIEEQALQLIFAPGHSPGHICFYNSKDLWLIGGDVLFLQSIGRTDLPGGSFETLQKSIQNKIYALPEETIVHPGHGPETSIGYEKRNNAFVQAVN